MRQKSEVFTHFQIIKNEVEKETGRHDRCLRSDRGKEYFSDKFSAYLCKEGIRREFTCWHTPQQNRVAESKNRHILEVARAMMNEKNLSKSYWYEAANTAIYLMNRCTTFGVLSFLRCLVILLFIQWKVHRMSRCRWCIL